jgi:asparagine synthase (glutamine-hydrolysing)
VLEFAARLKSSDKLRGRIGKYALRTAFSDMLPPENVNRKKMGFSNPTALWLRGPLKPLLADCLISSDARLHDFFDPKEINRLVRSHMAGNDSRTLQLWSLLMLELWFRNMCEHPCQERRRHSSEVRNQPEV